MKKSILLFLAIFLFSCKKNTTNIRLEKGMVISESVTVFTDTFKINSLHNQTKPALTIKGKNIVVDFQGAVLQGSNDEYFPNKFYGIGILVEGENIEIKNLEIKNYSGGFVADNVDGLKITNSKFNNNYKTKLSKKGVKDRSSGFPIKRLDFSDSAVQFRNSTNIIFKNNKITQNQHGINLQNCKNVKIYNNKITHNSGCGIKINISSELKIMHNYLDWNIIANNLLENNFTSSNAGGIRIINDSIQNIFAHNSISHSGKNEFRKSIVFKNNFFPFSKDSLFQNQATEKIPPLSDGQKTTPKKYKYWGEQYILFNEWGPYNFEYPAIWLREINEDKYTFAIFGPEGNWKIVDGNGFIQTSRQSGSMPATIVATKEKNVNPKNLSLKLEFIGVEFTDQFGKINPRGRTFKFNFQNDDE